MCCISFDRYTCTSSSGGTRNGWNTTPACKAPSTAVSPASLWFFSDPRASARVLCSVLRLCAKARCSELHFVRWMPLDRHSVTSICLMLIYCFRSRILQGLKTSSTPRHSLSTTSYIPGHLIAATFSLASSLCLLFRSPLFSLHCLFSYDPLMTTSNDPAYDCLRHHLLRMTYSLVATLYSCDSFARVCSRCSLDGQFHIESPSYAIAPSAVRSLTPSVVPDRTNCVPRHIFNQSLFSSH